MTDPRTEPATTPMTERLMTEGADGSTSGTPVADPAPPGDPLPGERRLARPPSERFTLPPEESVDAPPSGSVSRALVAAALVALAGAAAMVVLGGVLAFSAGLLVVAAVVGRAMGLAILAGAGPTLVRPRRAWLAVGLAAGTVGFAQLALWWYAGTEGGVLGPLDYLVETFGVLVPLEVVFAAIAAWWTAR